MQNNCTAALIFLLCLTCPALRVDAHPASQGGNVTTIQNRSQVFGQTSEACRQKNGFCMLLDACPAQLLTAERGLCTAEGTDCCREMPADFCGIRGGECADTESCGRAPREVGTRCPPGQVCCIWLT